MVFENKAGVQALATLFDAGTEDAKGWTYIQSKADGQPTVLASTAWERSPVA
jgi:hypothetical protein